MFFGKHDLQTLHTKICQNEIKPDIPWADMVWNHTGNVEILEIDTKIICTRKDFDMVTLPFHYTYDQAKSTCRKLSGGNITAFQNPGNLSNIDFLGIYGSKYEVMTIEVEQKSKSNLILELLWILDTLH